MYGKKIKYYVGRTVEDGEPAWKVLAEELSELGEIGGRDLLAEIQEAGP